MTPIVEASALVLVAPEVARSWFLVLNQHPEWYQFETHGGFEFTKGRFGEPGARFQTTETFRGHSLQLKFELTDVSDWRFDFHLLAPLSSIRGRFALQGLAPDMTRLHLTVGSDDPMRRLLLRLPPIHGAIRHQIQGEVSHIKASMEEHAQVILSQAASSS